MVEGTRSGLARAHQSRSFSLCPDVAEAGHLLDEIAKQPCDYGPVDASKPIALYGAGNLGRMARDFLKAVWVDFDFVVDRDADKHATSVEWLGTAVFAPESVPEELRRSHRVLVTVATAPYAPIEKGLLELGFTDVVPFYDFAESFHHIHPLSNGWFAAPFASLDLDMTKMVLSGWDDATSRAHYLQFLAWRRLRQEWTFDAAPVTGDDRFFIPEIIAVLRKDEVFIDGGAYHGDVTREFHRCTAGRWKEIMAIEPDPESYGRLTALNADHQLGRTIGISDSALGTHHHDGMFHAGYGYASQLGANGRESVKVIPLDTYTRATFVKLHLEGGELDALKGGRQMLQKNRPIIAATVYHNDDGIWRTELWLLKTLPDYRFLFRLHSWCGTGAVIYAIPNERSGR